MPGRKSCKKEKDSRQDELNALQAHMHKMESLESRSETLEKGDEELTVKIELREGKKTQQKA